LKNHLFYVTNIILDKRVLVYKDAECLDWTNCCYKYCIRQDSMECIICWWIRDIDIYPGN